MSSGYRGILRYDEVIRLLLDTESEGVILPPFPAGGYLDVYRFVEGAWVDLHDVSPIWVEIDGGGFRLHAVDIPEVDTVAVMMTPEELPRLYIDSLGNVAVKTDDRLLREAIQAKKSALLNYSRQRVDKARFIRQTTNYLAVNTDGDAFAPSATTYLAPSFVEPISPITSDVETTMTQYAALRPIIRRLTDGEDTWLDPIKDQPTIELLDALKTSGTQTWSEYMAEQDAWLAVVRSIGQAYSTHLTNLSNLGTYSAVVQYDITAGWPSL